jgi:4'-phosphopantetheinyl transferase
VLGSHEVAVFLARPEALDDGDRRAAALATLTEDEHAWLARFRFERDRTVALASRALQRRALSRCAPVPPDAWRFTATEHGRPEILAPASRLRFNVANPHGLVGCAVTIDREVGLDLERHRDDAPADIVDSHFAPSEQVALRALPAARQAHRFIELWTLKEAYLKARGVGLGLPLDGFWFELSDDEARLTIDPALGDDAATWQISRWAPTPGHGAALCVRRRPDEPPLHVDVRWDQG